VDLDQGAVTVRDFNSHNLSNMRSNLICWEQLAAQRQRMPRAHPLPDPSAQEHIPSEPCIRALMRLVVRYRDWHRKLQYRSSLAVVAQGHRLSCDRQFSPMRVQE
jgi:hypothetical protein